MSINLQSYKLAFQELSSSTKFDGLVQAIEDALNHLGDAAYGAFAPGKIFSLAQLKQDGATPGQALLWDSVATQWAPKTPSTGSYVQLADTTLGVDTASFSFTSISSAYRQLQLVCYLRSTRAATEDDLGIRFNNDTAANYDGYSFKASGTTPTVAGQEALAATSMQIKNGLTGDSATANQFGAVIITIPNYADTANNKTLHALIGKKIGTASGNLHTMLGTAGWRSSSAINRIDLLPITGPNFKAGSRVTLYGL